MDKPLNTLLVVALFILRLGVPLLVTLGIAYALKRLDARWQAEAESEAQARQDTMAANTDVQQRPAEHVVPNVGPMLPQTALARDGNGVPCWLLKGCTEAVTARCAAWHQPDLPCWMARTRAEGRLPATCKGCDLYQPMVLTPVQRQEVVH